MEGGRKLRLFEVVVVVQLLFEGLVVAFGEEAQLQKLLVGLFEIAEEIRDRQVGDLQVVYLDGFVAQFFGRSVLVDDVFHFEAGCEVVVVLVDALYLLHVELHGIHQRILFLELSVYFGVDSGSDGYILAEVNHLRLLGGCVAKDGLGYPDIEEPVSFSQVHLNGVLLQEVRQDMLGVTVGWEIREQSVVAKDIVHEPRVPHVVVGEVGGQSESAALRLQQVDL